MTRSARRALAAASAALLAFALTACSAASPPPRTTPDAVERAAVQQAVGFSGIGNVNPDIEWVQLWTPGQFPDQMQACAGTKSLGQMTLDVSTIDDGFRGISSGGTGDIVWQIVGSGTYPSSAQAHQIIDLCRALTPVDDRVRHLAPGTTDSLYSYDLTVLRPCLISHGFAVGAIPARDVFRRLLDAGRPWSPYDHVVVKTRLQWYAISDACPVLSPALAAKVVAP